LNSDGRRLRIDPTNKFVERIFNNGTWDNGGRFYGGWWQYIQREWRKHIRINGEAVKEPDYSGHHIAILYALEGIDYWLDENRDPYELEGIEHSNRMRDLLKEMLLIALNAKTRKAALGALNQKISKNIKAWKKKEGTPDRDFRWVREEKVSLGQLYDALIHTHSPIADHIGSGIGVRLQNIDAAIADRILTTCTDKGIPILSLHDGFVVPESAWKFVEQVMRDAYTDAIMTLTGMKANASLSGTATELLVQLISKLEKSRKTKIVRIGGHNSSVPIGGGEELLKKLADSVETETHIVGVGRGLMKRRISRKGS
jgi:hypothetical protein